MCEPNFQRSLIQGMSLIPIWDCGPRAQFPGLANILCGLKQVQDASWQVHSPLNLMQEAPTQQRGWLPLMALTQGAAPAVLTVSILLDFTCIHQRYHFQCQPPDPSTRQMTRSMMTARKSDERRSFLCLWLMAISLLKRPGIRQTSSTAKVYLTSFEYSETCLYVYVPKCIPAYLYMKTTGTALVP